MDQLASLFESSFNADPNIRLAGETQLKNLESQDGMLSTVLQLIFSDNTSISQPVRQAAAVYLKNRVSRAWSNENSSSSSSTTPTLFQSDKDFIKSHILNALINSEPIIKAQLGTALGAIVVYEFPQNWNDLIPNVIQNIQSDKHHEVQGGLIALTEVFKTYRYKKEEDSKKQINAVIDQVLPLLPPLGQSILESTPAPSAPERAGNLLHLIFKIYKIATHYELPQSLRQDESVVAWGRLLLAVVEREIAESDQPNDHDDRERFSWWKAKKWAYFILNNLHCRYGTPSTLGKTFAEYKAFAENFQANLAPTILKTYLTQIEKKINQNMFMTQRVIQLSINFMDDSIRPKSTWSLLKPHLETLLQHFIFPVICFTQEQAELINDDPEDFVKEHYVEFKTDYFKSPVTSALEFVSDLASSRKNMLLPLLKFITSICAEYPAKYSEREKDGAYRMIIPLAKTLVTNTQFTKDMEPFIVQYVLPDLSSQSTLLRARACEVIETFEQDGMEWSNPENLNKMFQMTTNLLTDPSVPVRVRAAMALPELVRYDEVREAIAPSIGRIMQEIFELSNNLDLDSLTTTSRVLVANFSNELVPFCTQLASQLVNSILRILNEVLELRQAENPDTDDFNEDKMLTAMGFYKTAQQLILALETSMDHLAHCETILIPALEFVLRHEFSELYDEVFELIDSLVYWQKKVSPNMWNIFELLHHCIFNDGLDCGDEIMAPFENFAVYGGQVFQQSERYKNMIVEIFQLVMTSDRVGATDRAAACKLAEIFILHNKGHIDNYIEPILRTTAPFVMRENSTWETEPTMTMDLHLRCIRLFISAIYYNPLPVLQWLETNGLIQSIFQKWFSALANYNRVHEKKLSILAISAMVSVVHSAPELVQQSSTQLITAALSIFGTLPEAIKIREKKEKEFTASIEDVSDDEDEFDDIKGAVKDEPFDDDEDVKESDDWYDEYIARQQKKALGSEGDGDDDDYDFDDDDLYDEEVLYESPLEEIDSYNVFKMALQTIDQSHPGALQSITESLDESQNTKLRETMNTADNGGEKSFKPAEGTDGKPSSS